MKAPTCGAVGVANPDHAHAPKGIGAETERPDAAALFGAGSVCSAAFGNRLVRMIHSEPKMAPADYQVATPFRRTSMTQAKDLRELFHETLKDIYFAEKKILGALPKMAKAAHSEELKAAFEKHETETEEHVDRLEKVFEEIDAAPRGKTCDAIIGIIEEGQEMMKEFKGMPALDAGLLAAAQAVEHYEISRYGTLKTWAAELGLEQSVKLLNATLAEEKKTDETLTKLAQSAVNQHAQAA
jgi:ferritin-like metal-binding protein YciE